MMTKFYLNQYFIQTFLLTQAYILFSLSTLSSLVQSQQQQLHYYEQ